MRATLKTYGNWKLNAVSRTKYFFYSTGRSGIKVETVYSIEHEEIKDTATEIASGVYNIKTKKEALSIWSELKKTHSIGGAALRRELFPKRGA